MFIVKRTERGWPGHFILSDRCLFRRNTLLERGSTRIVVSTVGLLVDIHANGYPNDKKIVPVGSDHYYETKAFQAKGVGRYWDADHEQMFSFASPFIIDTPDSDLQANEMHENVVNEITKLLEAKGDCIVEELNERPKNGNPRVFVTIHEGAEGWNSGVWRWAGEDHDGFPGYEPRQTGLTNTSLGTGLRDDAIIEARDWAERENLPLWIPPNT